MLTHDTLPILGQADCLVSPQLGRTSHPIVLITAPACLLFSYRGTPLLLLSIEAKRNL